MWHVNELLQRPLEPGPIQFADVIIQDVSPQEPFGDNRKPEVHVLPFQKHGVLLAKKLDRGLKNAHNIDYFAPLFVSEDRAAFVVELPLESS